MTVEKSGKWARLSCAGILGAIFVVVAFGCTAFGIRTVEEASYKVLSNYGQFELREYNEVVIVETSVDAGFEEAGNIAFRRLFGYISGGNVLKTKIEMTTPVLIKEENAPAGEKVAMTIPVLGERSVKGWRYVFVLPGTYTIESAPRPKDPEVKLSLMPKKKVAVIGYSGSLSEEAMLEKSWELVAWIQSKGLEIASKPRFAGYDPPWTIPFLRRNEIMIEIK